MKLRLLERVLLVFFFCLLVTNAEASEKIRLGVLRFESKADGVSDQQAEIITDLFTRELANSRTIAVYEREQLEHIGKEQRFGMSGLVDINTAVEVGRIAGLQYILLGSVTELTQNVSGGGVAFIGAAMHEARATINVRVIDVATSEVRLALSETGHSSNTTAVLALGDKAAFATSQFGGIQARAIADAVAKLGHSLRSGTTGEASHVLAVSNNTYILDVSAKEGALYLVYAEGRSILDMSGRVLGRDKLPIAVLKVRDSNYGHCVAVLAEGCKGDLIRRGDKVEPVTKEKSKQLLSGKHFITDRPSMSSNTFEQIFGGNQPLPEPDPVSETPEVYSSNVSYTTTSPVDVIESVPSAPAPSPPPPLTPIAADAPRVIEGFDPNTSTDAKVIDTYPLSSTARNTLGIKQRGAYNIYRKGQYKKAFEIFVTLVDEDYHGNYLSAYWAGMSAMKLRSYKEAAKWFDRAILINPNYKPAVDARAKIKL